MKKKIIALTLASTITLTGGEYVITEISVDSFQKDLKTFEVSTSTAENIARYSKGGWFNGDKLLNPSKDSPKEYARACNEALEIFRRLNDGDIAEFGGIEDKDILRLCNGLISDNNIQDYRRSLKKAKPLDI